MSRRAFAATRKGLVEFVRSRQGWQQEALHFPAERVSIMLDDQRDGCLYAALELGHFGTKLHRSEDRGKSWVEVSSPAFPQQEAVDEEAPSVSMLWALAAGGVDQPGLLWAGTIPGALFRSEDRGESWQLVDSLWQVPERQRWFGGGFDDPGIHTIHVDPRNSRHVMVAVSCGGIWQTYDCGQGWELIGAGQHAAYVPPELAEDLAIQDPHRLAYCASQPNVVWCQHHNGVFRSVDGAKNFSQLENAKPSGFGFAVAASPDDPATAWFVPAVKDEHRLPVESQLVVSRTRDGGESFELLRQGLPERSYEIVFRHALAIDDSGQRLAMGSSTGNLWISEDEGDSWVHVHGHLPPIHQVEFARTPK